MSSKFAGVTFDEQAATPSDDAIIRRAILDDGILTGCEFSYTGSTLTMTAGQLMICGRQIKHPSTQNWAVADATTGFARLLLTIDLTRTSSKDTFEQVVDTIEYASAVDGFADLVQDDINASGTKYQIVAAVVSLASGGISGIVSKLPLTSAGLGDKSVIIVKAPSGSTVTCSKRDIIKRTLERNGEWRFNGLDLGTWRINASKNGSSTYTDFKITEFGVYRITLAYQLYPDDFVFDGIKGVDYEIYQDDGTVIKEEDYRKYKNWKAKVFTSITVTPKTSGYVDVFVVGAGGGSSPWNQGSSGGGSGYTTTEKRVLLSANTPYPIEIGAGSTGDGGTTTAFGVNASGGKKGESADKGGDGASGGGAYKGVGGSDGSDGGDSSGRTGGTGQGTTTREFGEPEGDLYAGGGGGSDYNANNGLPGGDGGGGHGGGYKEDGTDGEPNTGSGAGGAGYTKQSPHSGGSGVVVFRNSREVA